MAAPLYVGDSGYRSGLDRDRDGIACEWRPNAVGAWCDARPMENDTIECPCGELGTWQLVKDDQFHPPFPPKGRLGEEVWVFITHPDGTRHLVHGGRVAG